MFKWTVSRISSRWTLKKWGVAKEIQVYSWGWARAREGVEAEGIGLPHGERWLLYWSWSWWQEKENSWASSRRDCSTWLQMGIVLDCLEQSFGWFFFFFFSWWLCTVVWLWNISQLRMQKHLCASELCWHRCKWSGCVGWWLVLVLVGVGLIFTKSWDGTHKWAKPN